MSKKLIVSETLIINSCISGNCSRYSASSDSWYCKKVKEKGKLGKELADVDIIPDWCPLEDNVEKNRG